MGHVSRTNSAAPGTNSEDMAERDMCTLVLGGVSRVFLYTGVNTIFGKAGVGVFSESLFRRHSHSVIGAGASTSGETHRSFRQ